MESGSYPEPLVFSSIRRPIALLAATALAGAFCSRAGMLRVSVSDVSAPTEPAYSTFPVSLSWTLAGNGLDLAGGLEYVRVDFLQGASVAKSFVVWPGEPGTSAGRNRVSLMPEQLPPPGAYTIRVSAVGAEVTGTAFYRVSNPSTPDQQFHTPRGVDVNRVEGSPHRGRVYVSEAVSGNPGARSTAEGVYVLNPDLSPAFPAPKATSALIGSLGPWGTSVYSPHRLTVDNEGSLYICDASDAHSALFIADPDVSEVKALLAYPFPAGGSRSTAGLVSVGGKGIYGSTAAVFASVAGGSRTLITCDEDLSPGNAVWRRTLPAAAVQDATVPTLFASYAGAPWTQDVAADAAGAVRVVSSTSDDARLYDAAGNLVRSLPANGVGYNGLALDEARGAAYLATGDGRIFRAALDFSTSAAVVNGLGAQITDVACDGDGWLYATNATTRRLDVFAPAGDAVVGGGEALSATEVIIVPPPVPGDIAPVGPEGINVGPNGQRFGDGAVDIRDTAEILRVYAGLTAGP